MTAFDSGLVASMVGFAAGTTSLLLVVAGAIKVLRPQPAAGSLRRASARLMRWPQQRLDGTARLVGVVEIAAGSAALLVPGRSALVPATFVLVLFASFVAMTAAARRRGDACGCWGSLSDGPAGDGEVERRLVLLALAVIAVIGRFGGQIGGRFGGTEHLQWTTAGGVVTVGLVVGALLVTTSVPAVVTRTVAAANVGVQRGTESRRSTVSGRRRRAVIAGLRIDPHVVAVAAKINAGSDLAWISARVTAPPKGSEVAGNLLVAVPGDGVNLRIVVNNGRPMMVIGESITEVVTLGGTRLTVTRKPGAPKALAA